MPSLQNIKKRLHFKKSNQKYLVIGVIAIGGVIALLAANAATFSIIVEPENGTKTNVSTVPSDSSGGKAIQFGGGTSAGSCGKRLTTYNYIVPFGNAVWNQPVCNLPRYARSADYATRFIEWSNVNDGNPALDYMDGDLAANPGFPGSPTITDPDGLFSLFSREVYYASDATMETKVATVLYPSNLDGSRKNSDPYLPKAGYVSKHPDATMPWNPAWKTGMGGDNEIFILDDRPGKNNEMYTIWGYKAGNCVLDALFFPNRVCASQLNISRDHFGNKINYKTHEGYVSDRGVGLSYYATLTTPEEVAAGEIRHALGISIPNTSFGAICTKQQLGTSAEGNTCGTAVAPASKFEWGGNPSIEMLKDEPYKSLYTISKTIPEGMRFALDITDSQIESWIASNTKLKNDSNRAKSARIFAKALRDYGMIVVDTNGAHPGIQMVGGVNPDHRAAWTSVSMGPEYGSDLLDGLINKNNLYVVEPPTLTCADGTQSKNFCEWISAKY